MTRQQLLTAVTLISILGAVIGFIGLGLDQVWGAPVSTAFGGVAVLGAILLVVQSSPARSTPRRGGTG